MISVWLRLTCLNCFQITQEGFKFISMGCSSLTTIILNELPGLRDDCVQVFTRPLRFIVECPGSCRWFSSLFLQVPWSSGDNEPTYLRLSAMFYWYFPRDNVRIRLDFRHSPVGPVPEGPPREFGERSAGSYSWTAAGNRAYIGDPLGFVTFWGS